MHIYFAEIVIHAVIVKRIKINPYLCVYDAQAEKYEVSFVEWNAVQLQCIQTNVQNSHGINYSHGIKKPG